MNATVRRAQSDGGVPLYGRSTSSSSTGYCRLPWHSVMAAQLAELATARSSGLLTSQQHGKNTTVVHPHQHHLAVHTAQLIHVTSGTCRTANLKLVLLRRCSAEIHALPAGRLQPPTLLPHTRRSQSSGAAPQPSVNRAQSASARYTRAKPIPKTTTPVWQLPAVPRAAAPKAGASMETMHAAAQQAPYATDACLKPKQPSAPLTSTLLPNAQVSSCCGTTGCLKAAQPLQADGTTTAAAKHSSHTAPSSTQAGPHATGAQAAAQQATPPGTRACTTATAALACSQAAAAWHTRQCDRSFIRAGAGRGWGWWRGVGGIRHVCLLWDQHWHRV